MRKSDLVRVSLPREQFTEEQMARLLREHDLDCSACGRSIRKAESHYEVRTTGQPVCAFCKIRAAA